MTIDREFLLIKREANRRALWNALTCGPEAMVSYAVGRSVNRLVVDAVIYGQTKWDVEAAARHFVKLYARLDRVKGRLNV